MYLLGHWVDVTRCVSPVHVFVCMGLVVGLVGGYQLSVGTLDGCWICTGRLQTGHLWNVITLGPVRRRMSAYSTPPSFVSGICLNRGHEAAQNDCDRDESNFFCTSVGVVCVICMRDDSTFRY